MLAAATFGILVSGPAIIGFIPVMVVGALIFYLGFDLMREALVNTWGTVNRLEYMTVIHNLTSQVTSMYLTHHRFSLSSLRWELGIL